LSEYASKQIRKHIIEPILDEKALQEFHPLVEQVPTRIGNKEITTLRELERTLIFLAPVSTNCDGLSDCAVAHWCSGVQEYSRSPNKYLRFCERTIRVLHTTVTTLKESDQRAPADRPYTQGYFFDLVEQVCLAELLRKPQGINIVLQIRRYAQILAAQRERQEKGEDGDAMEYAK
jgi:hypothetical protein